MAKAPAENAALAIDSIVARLGVGAPMISARIQPKRDGAVELTFAVQYPLPEGKAIGDATYAVGVAHGILRAAAEKHKSSFPGQPVRYEELRAAHASKLIFPSMDYLAVTLNSLLPPEEKLEVNLAAGRNDH